MKTTFDLPTLSVHKTFGKDEGKRKVYLFVSDGTTIQTLSETDIEKWVPTLQAGQILRFTSVHACDPLLLDLLKRGVRIVYANWHETCIAKNLPPAEIVAEFAKVPDSVFREFQPRPDLAELRYRLSQRSALVEYRKAVTLKLKGAARLYGQLHEEDFSEETKDLLKQADEAETRVPVMGKNGKEKMVSIDTVIANLAKNTRECSLFNAVAHIEGAWTTAATVVSLSGGVDRFDTVAAFWHYCGEHVVDGSAPKRRKGSPVTWNPKIRTALWSLGDSIMKNRNNPWREFYEDTRAQEMETHLQKHPGCKTINGHCTARALRKMRKEILKRFFLAVKGQEYRESGDRIMSENQHAVVAA